jgi:hypothetical protein
VSSYWKSLILSYKIILGRRNRRRINTRENLQTENINHTGNGQDKETVTWKTVGETTDVIFGLVFSLMIILVYTLYFVDVNGHPVF